MRLDYEINDKKILEALNELLQSGRNTEPLFTDIGEALLNSHQDRFAGQISPEGDPWEPLNAKYRARKKKNADQILVFEGFMRDTLAYNASSQYLELGTNRIQGATHQFGDEERGIPARPFLGVSEEDEIEILNILHDHFSLD